MRKYRIAILGLVIQFSLISCVTLNITSKSFVSKGLAFKKRDSFFLESIKITSYNFFENDEIRYIMDRKLQFALLNNKEVSLGEERRKADYIIVPELIIKNYQKRYDEKGYYMMSVKIYSRKGLLCQFNYEYNGTLSIFDRVIQDAMIKGFLRDFTRNIKT